MFENTQQIRTELNPEPGSYLDGVLNDATKARERGDVQALQLAEQKAGLDARAVLRLQQALKENDTGASFYDSREQRRLQYQQRIDRYLKAGCLTR